MRPDRWSRGRPTGPTKDGLAGERGFQGFAFRNYLRNPTFVEVATALPAMIGAAFKPEWIWGDDTETTVFAQGYGSDHTVIFSFCLDSSKPPSTLPNRICTSFHGLDATTDTTTFPDADSMRRALWEAVHIVWPQCLEHPRINDVDAVVDIDASNPQGEISWRVYHHRLFPRYLQCLGDEAGGLSFEELLSECRRPPNRIALVGKPASLPETTHSTVDFGTLVRYEQLGGKGCATRVRIRDGPPGLHVFKGVDFRTYLAHCDDENDETVRHLVRCWNNSETLLRQMPPHPNILPASSVFVTLSHGNGEAMPAICGSLQPLYAGGDVGDSIGKSNKAGQRLPLELKAHWCANMAAAVAHTHRVARTFHMDIKPGNFLIDFNNNLALCDWEQVDAPPNTLAPEADGTWDVSEDKQDGTSSGNPRPRLVYEKYTGPARQNIDEDLQLGESSWHSWNVFPSWNIQHPLALELAEVFSLGRIMWMLLRQPNMDFDEIEHPNDLITDWEAFEDIPESWKQMVDRCLSLDPNMRPDVIEVAQFWGASRQLIMGGPENQRANV